MRSDLATADDLAIRRAEDERYAWFMEISLVDLGLPGDKVKKQVRIGDFVVWHEPLIDLGNKAASKAMDNRVACWLGIESVRQLEASGGAHDCELYVVFTVQEEVGIRGAKTSAFGIDPDIGVGIDVTLACDTPGVPADESVSTAAAAAARPIERRIPMLPSTSLRVRCSLTSDGKEGDHPTGPAAFAVSPPRRTCRGRPPPTRRGRPCTARSGRRVPWTRGRPGCP